MKNTRSIYSLIAVFAVLALLVGCAKQGSVPAEERPGASDDKTP